MSQNQLFNVDINRRLNSRYEISKFAKNRFSWIWILKGNGKDIDINQLISILTSIKVG